MSLQTVRTRSILAATDLNAGRAISEMPTSTVNVEVDPRASEFDTVSYREAAETAQQKLAREHDRLRLLLEINRTLVSNIELRALFSAIIGTLRNLVPHEYTSLVIYDAERKAIELGALEFEGKGLVTEKVLVPPDAPPAGIAFAAGKPMRFDRADLEELSHDFVKRLLAEGVQSVCCVP